MEFHSESRSCLFLESSSSIGGFKTSICRIFFFVIEIALILNLRLFGLFRKDLFTDKLEPLILCILFVFLCVIISKFVLPSSSLFNIWYILLPFLSRIVSDISLYRECQVEKKNKSRSDSHTCSQY